MTESMDLASHAFVRSQISCCDELVLRLLSECLLFTRIVCRVESVVGLLSEDVPPFFLALLLGLEAQHHFAVD